MKTKILIIALILLLPIRVFAAEEKTELAKELMELLQVNKLIEQLDKQVEQIQMQMVSKIRVPEDKEKEAEIFEKRIHNKLSGVLGYQHLEQEYLKLFKSFYSLEDLKEIVRFYNSPAGKSMIQNQPKIFNRAREQTQEKLKTLLPEVEKIAKEYEAAMKE